MARSLSSKPNIVSPGGDYPYGRIKDNPGDGTGTPVNETVYGDIHQFFERLLAVGSVTANNLPENNANGFQYITALQAIINSYITTLKDGVPSVGDTLNKLYNLITSVGRSRGGYDASVNVVPGSASNEAGDFWRITVAGTISGLLSGSANLKPGDLLFADVDGATNANQFYSIQSNVDQATSTTLGLTKLYNSLGNETDGAPTNEAVENLGNEKVSKSGDTMTGTLTTRGINVQTGFGVVVDNGNIQTNSGQVRSTTGNGFFGGGINTDNVVLKTKTIEIGDWDMDANAAKSVAHGLPDHKKIRSYNVVIRNDTDNGYNNLGRPTLSGTNDIAGGVIGTNTTDIILSRTTGGFFDDTDHNSTSFNRGWVTIEYEA